MFNSKKGMTVEFIVGIIIVLVSFGLIAGTITTFVNRSDVPVQEKVCQDSVVMRASTALRTDSKDIQWSPLLCKTIDLKTNNNKEDTMYLIAEKSARSWEMFGAGRYEEILKKMTFSSVLGFPHGSNDCFLTYSIVTGEFIGEISPEEMQEYLATNNYSRYPDTTYLDYITYRGGGPGVFLMEGPIKPNHAYGLSYMAKNRDEVSWGFTVTGVTTTTIAVVGGAIICPFTAGVGCGIAATAIGAAGIITASSEIDANLANLKSERDVSITWLTSLEQAQKICFQGDLGGK